MIRLPRATGVTGGAMVPTVFRVASPGSPAKPRLAPHDLGIVSVLAPTMGRVGGLITDQIGCLFFVSSPDLSFSSNTHTRGIAVTNLAILPDQGRQGQLHHVRPGGQNKCEKGDVCFPPP